MKRKIALFLILAFAALLLFGCAKAPEEPSSAQPETATLSAEDTEKAWLRENLPSMDGSTSLIPLETGIRAALFGISEEEAGAQVNHTTTWGAFYNLMSGETDLIFSCPLSQEQRDQLAAQDVTLEEIPVAMEAFVFAVNAENPVDTLTQQQIKDIYSGEITNWKELGGNDEAIIAYQRNTDSGSQNYMIDFMGDTPLTDAPTELRPHSMGGLMDAIAVNDNAAGAIGYSVYAYAADMYANSSSVKFIKVDGVAPDRATIADKTYPLLGYNYAMYRADVPEDGAARRLVNYILSEEGQRAVAEAGYVAVKEIGYDYTAVPAVYTGVGKDGEAPETPGAWETVLDLSYNTFSAEAFLKDKALAQEIEAFLASAENGLHGDNVRREISAKNGYLSALVFTPNPTGYANPCKKAVSATWDLRTGKRISPEELFFDGVDINKLLTDYVRWYTDYMSRDVTAMEFVYETAAEFTALPETGWCLTADQICFNSGVGGFPGGARVPLSLLPRGNMVTELPYDMTSHFEETALGAFGDYEKPHVNKQFVRWNGNVEYKALDDDYFLTVTLLNEEVYPTAAAINASVKEYAQTYFSRDALERYGTEHGGEINYTVEFYGLSGLEFLGRYFLVYPNAPWAYGGYYPYCDMLIYDIATGERIPWTSLLKDGWLAAASVRTDADDTTSPASPDVTEMTLLHLDSENGAFIITLSPDMTNPDHVFLDIPFNYVNLE